MFEMLKDNFESKIIEVIPESSLIISDDKKVDIIISVMSLLRNNVSSWTERAFKATSWSAGILISFITFWIINGKTIPLMDRVLISFGIFFFGIFMQFYLFSARRAHKGNGVAIAKCEVALKLCKKDFYINETIFFGYSGKWLNSKSLTVLQYFSAFLTLFAIILILFLH